MREGLKWILPDVPGQISYLYMHACVPTTLVQDHELKINVPQLDLLYFGENIMGARYVSMREHRLARDSH